MTSNYLLKKNIKNYIPLLFWTFALMCYFFQFLVRTLASGIVPFLVMFIFFERKNIRVKKDWLYIFLFSTYAVFIAISSMYSAFSGTELNRILRFFTILFMIPLCPFIAEKRFFLEFNVLIMLAAIKCLILIGIGIYLIKIGTHSAIRNWAVSSGAGDIYFWNGRPKVQVQGNGLLPFVFILYNYPKIRINFVSAILFFGCLFAGNFAFLLGLALFFIYVMYKVVLSPRNSYGHISACIILLALICLPFCLKYVEKVKSEKSGYSNAIRVEQAKMLFDTNVLVGRGIGAPVFFDGIFRQVRGGVYFELQTLFIFYQIGSIGLTLFYLTVLMYLYQKHKPSFALFLIYLIYSFWNPYCFDTTEMIALILVINIPYLRRIEQL